MSKHPLLTYRAKVEHTHKGLGNLAAFTALSTKARKCAMVIGSSGTGKTTGVNAALQNNGKTNIQLDSLTRSGLKTYEDQLNGFEGILCVQDLGSIDTAYSLAESLKVLAVLAYERQIAKNNSLMELSIKDFKGATITTAQPIMMTKLLRNYSWEAVLSDKVLRYYHMYRPTKTTVKALTAKLPWGISVDKVAIPGMVHRSIMDFCGNNVTQWSYARGVEHLGDLVKAAAAFRRSTKVQSVDLSTVLDIIGPLWYEKHLVRKAAFEAHTSYDIRSHCVLTELCTYGSIEQQQTCQNYRISERTYYRLMNGASAWCVGSAAIKGAYVPSEQFEEISAECEPHIGGTQH